MPDGFGLAAAPAREDMLDILFAALWEETP
jgi:hypothetical protein